MNKVVVQESGYRISVTSWENDADNYNFKSITLENADDARVVVALCKLACSRYTTTEQSFGNMYEPSESDIQEFEAAIAQIPGINEYLKAVFNWYEEAGEEYDIGAKYADAVLDIYYDLGLSGSEHYYTRVCDKIEVHYFAEPVYAMDLTTEFVK